MLAAFAALVWAFGWERAALAAMVWGTYFPGRLWWTGGSFLRWDWLAALLAGLALCRRDRPFAGGALLAYAALSRVFPVFALAGAGLARWWPCRRRKGRPRDRPLCWAAAAVATALLVPIAGAVRSGPGWSEFTRNLAKHTSVPSPNRMGLAAVVAFDPATTHRALERRRVDVRPHVGVVAGAVAARPARGLGAARAAGRRGDRARRPRPAGVGGVRARAAARPAVQAARLLLLRVRRRAAAGSERRADVAGIALALALASGIVGRLSGFGRRTIRRAVAAGRARVRFIASSFLDGARSRQQTHERRSVRAAAPHHPVLPTAACRRAPPRHAPPSGARTPIAGKDGYRERNRPPSTPTPLGAASPPLRDERTNRCNRAANSRRAEAGRRRPSIAAGPPPQKAAAPEPSPSKHPEGSRRQPPRAAPAARPPSPVVRRCAATASAPRPPGDRDVTAVDICLAARQERTPSPPRTKTRSNRRSIDAVPLGWSSRHDIHVAVCEPEIAQTRDFIGRRSGMHALAPIRRYQADARSVKASSEARRGGSFLSGGRTWRRGRGGTPPRRRSASSRSSRACPAPGCAAGSPSAA